MTLDEKIAEYKADIEKCEHVRTTTAIKSIREAATKKAEDCKQMVEWLEDYKRLKTAEITGDEFVDAASALTEELPFT